MTHPSHFKSISGIFGLLYMIERFRSKVTLIKPVRFQILQSSFLTPMDKTRAAESLIRILTAKDQAYEDLNAWVAELDSFDDEAAIKIREAWRREHPSHSLAREDAVGFLDCYIRERFYNTAQLEKSHLDSMIEPLVLTFFDVMTDIYVAAVVLMRGKYVLGCALLTPLLLANMLNAFTGLAQVEYPMNIPAALLGLLGFKPIWHVYHITINRSKDYDNVGDDDPRQRVTMPPQLQIHFTHIIDALCESIPAGFLQFYLLVSQNKQQSLLNVVSLVTSTLTTGYLLAIAARDIDTDPRHRSHHPHVHGYVPIEPWAHLLTTMGQVVFVTGMCSARTAAVGLLASVSIILMLVFTTFELILFGILRTIDRSFKFFASRFDGITTSCLVHFLWYWLGTCAAPSVMRDGHVLGPHWYALLIVYTLAISNPLMVGMALGLFSSDKLRVSRKILICVFLASEVIAFLGAGLTWAFMNQRYRKTFYEYLTYRDYLEKYWWPNNVHSRLGDGHDAARATVILMDTPYYWNKEQVLHWVRSRWAAWHNAHDEDKPAWYDDDFIERLEFGLKYFGAPNFIDEELRMKAHPSRRYE